MKTKQTFSCTCCTTLEQRMQHLEHTRLTDPETFFSGNGPLRDLEHAAMVHLAVHQSAGRQSKRLREGWVWGQDEDSFGGLVPINLATGEQCGCNDRRWMLDKLVLICTECFVDCT